ncbi:MAG TPA: aminoacyl-tRNA hydrolase [Candidatus Anaerofilum excrementigallinarum]|nr:aminoacyl-tRNA hydrolase [Candidatus Anaerofilum excrementigallinarum]
MGFPFTSKTKQEGDEWLVAGLGNPEPRYDGTRHNAGFEALDELAKRWNISINRSKFQGLYGAGTVDGRKVVLLKPLTYMNLSGDSIAAAASFFKIPPQRVLVLCDDIAQAPGKIRIRRQGSAGGHNGLKSIIARLGSQEFPRIRIGVGEKPSPDADLANWVLGHFSPEDKKAVEGRYGDIEDAARLIFDGSIEQAMSRHNG